MLRIGEFSKLCSLPVRTLRYYDREGLLSPDKVDPDTGYRYYSPARLADCHRITALKELGFSLDEVRRQMHSTQSGETQQLVRAKIAELNDTVTRINNQLLRLQEIQNRMTEGEDAVFDVVIKRSDGPTIAFVRKIFSSKQEAYEEIEAIRRSLPKQLVGSRSVIVNNETEYRESGLDLVAGVEIISDLPAEIPYCIARPTPSDTAVLICSRDSLESAYRAMLRQLDTLSCQITGAFTELYYDDGTLELRVPVCRLSQPEAPPPMTGSLPFEDDPEVVGRWEFVDLVPSEEQFHPQQQKYGDRDRFWLKELYFLPQGQGYWVVDGWTKGILQISTGYPKCTLRHSYRITHSGNDRLLLVSMKNYETDSCGGKPVVCVYRKTCDQAYTLDDIPTRDCTDLPFQDHPALRGTWKAIDLVKSPDRFCPSRPQWPRDGLFFRQVTFQPDGEASAIYGDQAPYRLHWTKGYLLDHAHDIAETCRLEVIDHSEYLFIEWKSGDVIYGHRQPVWYVFQRA